eukprot:764569-Hanusia_phi.AAC.5
MRPIKLTHSIIQCTSTNNFAPALHLKCQLSPLPPPLRHRSTILVRGIPGRRGNTLYIRGPNDTTPVVKRSKISQTGQGPITSVVKFAQRGTKGGRVLYDTTRGGRVLGFPKNGDETQGGGREWGVGLYPLAEGDILI